VDRPLVRVEVSRGIATITLDSPDNRNALSTRLVADLNIALDRAEQPDVRVIVLDHVAPAFCAGADLKERTAAGSAPALPTDGPNSMARAMARLRDADQPTIAAVKGPARAGGVGLMASCDLVVVRPDADFAFTEVRIGVAPAIISVPILRRVNWSAIAAPFLTGERFDAHEARRIGLVTHVAEDVDAEVRRLCDGVLKGGPIAVAATKRLLRQDTGAPFLPALDDMAVLSDGLFRSDEGMEGMRSFLEKRLPRWVSEE
jgi:enoyl-CoA hydratase/carnithine racemase